MPTTSQIEISKLNLDLKNFRTTPQKNEIEAVKAMISIKEDKFFGIMESIIDNGFLFIENIIVLREGNSNKVKEGNRRIAILKIIHGILKIDKFNIRDKLKEAIKKLDETWKKENSKVSCIIYNLDEAEKADSLVALAHGKAEKAGRDPWSSVARARHNRDAKQSVEPGLDILEKYLKFGQNLTGQQKERWGGDYPLSVLDDALRRIAPRLGFKNSLELSIKYPTIPNVLSLNEVLLDIGLENIGFPTMRKTENDFLQVYGISPVVTAQEENSTNNTEQTQNDSTSTSGSASNQSPEQSNNSSNTSNANTGSTQKPIAYASNDPKHIAGILKKFNPRGDNREKVVVLRDEIKKLKIKENPLAFCFILRSMFEISAKAYCVEHNISTIKSGGKDKTLVENLRTITHHLTNNNASMVKVLHGAMTEISKPDGILSVTSMNQLVHNPTFSISPSDICILFGNIYPLLELMN